MENSFFLRASLCDRLKKRYFAVIDILNFLNFNCITPMLTCGSMYFMETRRVAPIMFSVMLITQISGPFLEEYLKEGFNGVVAWTVNFFPILTVDG